MRRTSSLIAATVGAALLLYCATASAATINVNSTADGVENGGVCTLREAVISANANTTALGCSGDTAGADTIRLTGGQTYTLTEHGVDDLTDVNMKGDLDINSTVMIESTGPGLATIDGDSNPVGGDLANRDRILHVLPASGGVTLIRVKIFDGLEHSGLGGGGIRADAPLSVIDSEIVGNSVAASTPAQNTWGGGIYFEGPAGTSVNLLRSTVAENVVDDSGNESADGGGIMVYNFNTSLVATNSTISGNQANEDTGTNTDALGGGIFLLFGTATLTNTTITNNSASGRAGAGEGGGIYNDYSGKATISGTIVAGNTATTTGSDCRGSVPSAGSNLVGSCTLTGGSNDLVGMPAGLGPLADYGGPTRTHILNPTSLAINHGGACPETDQRGYFRFNVPPCDTGALELGASMTPPPSPPVTTPSRPTGQRAAALKKCKKKKSKKARKKCRKRALKLPV